MQTSAYLIDEPSLDELFAEPVIQLMMKRDGALRATIESALAERLQQVRQPKPVLQ